MDQSSKLPTRKNLFLSLIIKIVMLGSFLVLLPFLFRGYRKKNIDLVPPMTYSFTSNTTGTPEIVETQSLSIRGGADTVKTATTSNLIVKPSPQARGKILASYKSQIKLTPRQREISIGVMLGDASLQKVNENDYRLKFQTGEKREAYAQHLYKEFDSFCLSNPQCFTRKPNANGNVVHGWSLQTFGHSDFQSLKELFIDPDTGIKVIPPDLVENHLTSTGLAYWFMDDGSKMDHGPNQGKGIHLHTQGFQESEVDSLCAGLKQKFQLDCWRGQNKGKPIIVISGKSYDKFLELVKPDLIPSMLEKLPSGRVK